MRRVISAAVWVGIPIILLLFPPPAGLSVTAWHLFAIYIAAIIGLVLRPLPEAGVLLAIIAASGLLFRNTSTLLLGYANGTVWLVFTAFMIGAAIIESGLGRRVAYLLIGRVGSSSLGLGYVFAVTDLILAPVTPSNTARSGGIVFPILRSVARSLGSPPGPQGRRIGAYLTVLLYSISLTTGYTFLTAIAPNLLTAKFGIDILKVDVTWSSWLIAAAAPALASLFLLPLIVYLLYPPELKRIDNRRIAAEGLAELGPVTRRERILMVLFVLAILGWATGSLTGLDATTVAISFVAATLVTGVVKWDVLLNQKSGWSTFMWYGGIVGLADALTKAKFFSWLAQVLSAHIGTSGSPIVMMGALVLLSVVIRYIFASQAAFVTAMVPVLFTVGTVAHLPAAPFFFLTAFATCYGGMTTHYGGALGPVLFGDGYVDQRTWWIIGGVNALSSFVVNMVVGLVWWSIIGLW